ncbi:MAG: family 20 glycosylhydrolase [Planctomycetota bacterium]
MKHRGLLIDCSRVVERHAYYFRLIELMAAWNYNTLVFHFNDDHGLSVKLPGFQKIAQPYAMTCGQVRKLITHAADHGIEVIPELETFGHTRYLTDQPQYRHLFAGQWSRKRTYNAIDPRHPETFALMRRLMRETSKLFPSDYLHIGCDEVDLKHYAQQHGGLDTKAVWAEYVNRMITMAIEHGKTPMLWADHLMHDPEIARQIDKRAIPVWWNYQPDGDDSQYRHLLEAGFEKLWMAPSTSNGRIRFLPTTYGLDNVDRLARFAHQHRAHGFLNTVWEPHYGLQGAHDYGIAYAAESCRAQGKLDRDKFNRRFVKQHFGTSMDNELRDYLADWPSLHITDEVTYWLVGHRTKLSKAGWDSLRQVNQTGRAILSLAADYSPSKNVEAWRAMRIAARAAWAVSEFAVLKRWGGSPARKQAHNQMLKRVRREVADEWDRTRHPDDPRKHRSAFTTDPYNYAIVLLQHLKPLPARA